MSTLDAYVNESTNDTSSHLPRTAHFARTGAFHVECMYTEKDGAILIEVNPRAGGGPSREFHLAVREQDPMINFFLSHMNIPINPPRVPAKIAAIGYVAPRRPCSHAQVPDYRHLFDGCIYMYYELNPLLCSLQLRLLRAQDGQD